LLGRAAVHSYIGLLYNPRGKKLLIKTVKIEVEEEFEIKTLFIVPYMKILKNTFRNLIKESYPQGLLM
jgi:hypothetical protein